MSARRSASCSTSQWLRPFILLVSLLSGCPHHPIVRPDASPDGSGSEVHLDAGNDRVLDGPTEDSDAFGAATVLGPDGSSVQIPAGASVDTSTVSIGIASGGYPAIPVNVQLRGNIYGFTPHQQSFAVPVLVTVPFSGAGTTDPASLGLYTAEPGGTWSAVTGASLTDGAFQAYVNHFSYFFVGTTGPGTTDGGTSTPACSTCMTHTLPACANPSSDPSAFGLTCCPSDAPYFLCNGTVGCAAVPTCCNEACSCTLSCTGGA